MSTRYNEIEKLTATALNTLGMAAIVTGVLAPASAAFGPTPPLDPEAQWTFALSSIGWLWFGLILHIAGRAWLERGLVE